MERLNKMKKIFYIPTLIGALAGVLGAQDAKPDPSPAPSPVPASVLADPQWKEVFKDSIKKDLNTSIQELITTASAIGIRTGLHEMAYQIQSMKLDMKPPKSPVRNYERGVRALDQRKWDEAITLFDPIVTEGKERADAALYWKAYALTKLGRTSEAMASLDVLSQKYPQSRWLSDAKALKVEAQSAAGRPVSPEEESDEDLKLIAINGLMRNDPERALPLLENLISRNSSPRLRERVLFVLGQSNSPQSREIVTRIAKGNANPDLQMKAVRHLGVYGGKQNSQLLADIYAQTNDSAVRREVMHGLMVAGEKDRLLDLAKSEKDPELNGMAIHLLGAMGARQELVSLYTADLPKKSKENLIHALFARGSSSQLISLARQEKDPELKKAIIRLLSTKSSKDKEVADFLMEFLNQ